MANEIQLEYGIDYLEKWWSKQLDRHKDKEVAAEEIVQRFLKKVAKLSVRQIEKAEARYNHERRTIQITCPA